MLLAGARLKLPHLIGYTRHSAKPHAPLCRSQRCISTVLGGGLQCMHASRFPVRGRPLPAMCMVQCQQSVLRSGRHNSPQQPRQYSVRSRDAVSVVSHSIDAAERFVITTPLYYVNAGKILTLLVPGC